MPKYLCKGCSKGHTLYTKTGKFNSCPHCGANTTPIKGYKKKDLRYVNKFTPEEIKKIFNGLKKHIKRIPTPEQLAAKNRVKKHREKMLQKQAV